MNLPDDLRLDYRPLTYWGELGTLLGTIKGQWRREAVEAAIREGSIAEIPPDVIKHRVSEGLRKALGRLDPRGMGGEYLPDTRPQEAEIARIVLDSVTLDVISIRARKHGGRIRYSMADEYDGVFRLTPSSSEQPLTLSELIRLIDTAKCELRTMLKSKASLPDCYRDYNLREGAETPEELGGFVRVLSPFYPQLENWYRLQARDWVRARRAEWRASDEEEEE